MQLDSTTGYLQHTLPGNKSRRQLHGLGFKLGLSYTYISQALPQQQNLNLSGKLAECWPSYIACIVYKPHSACSSCSQENFENLPPEIESGSSFDEKVNLMVSGYQPIHLPKSVPVYLIMYTQHTAKYVHIFCLHHIKIFFLQRLDLHDH